MIKIVPAKKYVKMEYFPAHSKQQMIQRFEQETRRETGNEFVECLAFSGETGVVMTGNQTEEAEPDKVGTNKSVSDIVFRVWCSYDREPDKGGGA